MLDTALIDVPSHESAAVVQVDRIRGCRTGESRVMECPGIEHETVSGR